jgi:hypothetical protein
VLPPGGEGEVKVTLTPKGNHEDILKRIVVVSNDPKQPRFTLTMKGKLLVDVRVEPGSLNIANIPPGEPGTLEFSVTIRDPSTTEIESVKVEDQDNFELRPLEVADATDTKPAQLRYELRFRGSKTVGNFGSRVEIRTTGPNTPQLNIPIRASVVSNLRYSKRLHFSVREQVFATRQIRISTRDGVPVKIKKIVDSADLLVLDVRDPTGGTVVIDARIDEAKFNALPEHERGKPGTLTIHTNDPDEPRVEITYSTAVPAIRAHRTPE